MHIIAITWLTCTGTIASISGNSGGLRVRNGILVSLPSNLSCYGDPGKVFELLCDMGYDINFAFLAFKCS